MRPANGLHSLAGGVLGEASVTLTGLLPVLLPNIQPVARALRAGDGSERALGLGPQRVQLRSQAIVSGPLIPPARSPLGGLWRTRPAASYLCFSLGRLTSLSPLPTHRPPSVHMGLNVFITCLTRCLIASPLNGAVTVETRNKRPPENEMIKQVTLAKQTQPRNLWGWGGEAIPSPHPRPEGSDQTGDQHPYP